ncbi:M12 family metallo-peptidase [Lentzea kentuckyensis]|uniref:M12 family metallo-peptidase n=1 Tax=Lentzea kentuckyensis TaxID=360086 RepID=UPI000A386FFC|nr:M12 family metallo-peptidase [Lentzea kentuckyensis]
MATRSPLARGRSLAALVIAVTVVALLPVTGTAAPSNPWTAVSGGQTLADSAKEPEVRATRFAGFALDRGMMASTLDARAVEDSREVLLPTPEGAFQRFRLVNSPVMEPGLAAAHPEIRTYAGRGIDDPAATVRADLTPLGFHASVRSSRGQWYVDPYYRTDQSLYASYYGHDVAKPASPLVERATLKGAVPDAPRVSAGSRVKLRTYRLALVSDPSYAAYFGAANVTAAKVTLVNRVAQIYEDESAIRLLLVKDTDRTNLNTTAMATEPNGPCGAEACFRPDELTACDVPGLYRNQTVVGQLVGAGNYDIGHLALGVNGGGLAQLGVAGGADKALGCTGLPTPVGDFFAVDYVAHELGHQFGANHPFNGTQYGCSEGNRNAATSTEPGSGSSIMAYAGICQQDNLQPHSDPYWSQRSYTEINSYVTGGLPKLDEVQNVSLRDFDGTDSFRIGYRGHRSVPIVRGENFSDTGIKAAIEAIEGWPSGATVDVLGFSGHEMTDAGFQVSFTGGPVAGKDVQMLTITAANGTSGFVRDTVKGGKQDNGGWRTSNTANHIPVVTVAPKHTIPVRTPFALTGSAIDTDRDTITYMWEQTDRGGATGTALVNNTKTEGPLFRQFGTAAIVSTEDSLKYYSPGLNATNTNPARVFPDLAQIAANNTNARTGTCPAAPPPPTTGGATNVPAALIDCYSEFLPTADWVGPDQSRTLHFRLTARDGRQGGGGIGSADTAVLLAPSAGPFLLTSQESATTFASGSSQTITWDVARTDVAPIGVRAVRISLSVDGGLTFPHVLAERTPNNGAATVTLPRIATTKGRIKIEAIGNIFFDLNDADITLTN